MFKRAVQLFFAGALVLGLGIPANAAQGGSITVSLDAGELPVLNGAMTLYQVGIPVEGGYRIEENFGGGMVKLGDAGSSHLALWLAEGAGESGKTINLDVDGNVTFSNLPDGLYLLMQTQQMDGFHPVTPFLVSIPTGNQRQIHYYPQMEPLIWENPQTGDTLSPLLGIVGMAGSAMGLLLCRKKQMCK